MDTKEPKTPSWLAKNIVGLIAILIALIPVCLNLFDRISTRLEVYLVKQEYHTNRLFQQIVSNNSDENRAFQMIHSATDTFHSWELHELIFSIELASREKRAQESSERLTLISPYHYSARIVNSSNATLNDVVCIVRDNVYYEYSIGDSIYNGYINGRINIGKLLPKEEVNLELSGAIYEPKFVYEKGEATVHNGIMLYGLGASIGWFISKGFLWVLSPILLLLILNFFIFKDDKKQKIETTNSVEKDSELL